MTFAGTKVGIEAETLYAEAFEKWNKAMKLGGKCYNLACLYALRGENENAFLYLKRALEAGEETVEYVMKDKDWVAYRENEAFLTLVRRFDKTT